MATLTEWPLPLSNNFGFYLRFLTPEKDGTVFYTKYIADKIGELNVKKKHSQGVGHTLARQA